MEFELRYLTGIAADRNEVSARVPLIRFISRWKTEVASMRGTQRLVGAAFCESARSLLPFEKKVNRQANNSFPRCFSLERNNFPPLYHGPNPSLFLAHSLIGSSPTFSQSGECERGDGSSQSAVSQQW